MKKFFLPIFFILINFVNILKTDDSTGLGDETIFEEIKNDMKKGPLSYAAIIGTAFCYASIPKEKNGEAFVFLAILNSFYHGLTASSWIRLRTELLQLRQKKTSGPLIDRTQWCGMVYDTGDKIIKYYLSLSDNEKNNFKKSLLLEMQVRSETEAQALIEEGLSHYEKKLMQYEKNSNMLFYLARAAGFQNDPKELLTSDYLIKYDFVSFLQPTFDYHITGSWIARSFTVRPVWSKTFGVRVPQFFTWNYKVASECIWLTLKRYSCLKALLTIFETVTVSHIDPSINLNIHRR